MHRFLALVVVLTGIFGHSLTASSSDGGHVVPDGEQQFLPEPLYQLNEGEALVGRTIVALYDGDEESTPSETRIHQLAEMPLNHLGYKLIYWDINKGLPNVKGRTDIAAAITWFEQPIEESISFLEWTLEVSETGAKIILIGSIETDENWANQALLDVVLGRLGLAYAGDFVETTYRAEIVKLDPEVFSFERPLASPLPPFPVMQPVSSDVEAHVVLSVPYSRGKTSAVVATSPRGGFAASNFVVYYEPLTNRMKWLLNPFAFFERALGMTPRPIPEVTTLSGRRIYFSHIDGDGWNNISEVEKYKPMQAISAEVVLHELIEAFPDLPVTVGVIAGDIDPELGGSTNAADIASQLFALPQVEVASHTYTHPFDWSFFESYDRDRELSLIDETYVDDRNLITRYIDGVAARYGHSHRSDRYTSGSDDLPRVYMNQPFDLDLEVAGALSLTNSLAPEGKRTMVYLWSGDTSPFESAVRAVRDADAMNLNGGDSRFDMEWPSLAYVPPIARTVGRERQIYAVNSNENTYTNDWTGPYYGQALLSETLKNTDFPRRLKGVNLYYHMYTGERPASLSAVRAELERARQARVIPITASHYAAIAEGFFDVQIIRTGRHSWRVVNRGALNTVRFDQPGRFRVDLKASNGVAGYTFHNGSLYVSLDPATDVAEFALTDRNHTDDPVFTPRLVESRWLFSNFRSSDCKIEADVNGFGDGAMVFAGVRPGGYGIKLSRNASLVWEGTSSASQDGMLSLTIPVEAQKKLHLRVECQ